MAMKTNIVFCMESGFIPEFKALLRAAVMVNQDCHPDGIPTQLAEPPRRIAEWRRLSQSGQHLLMLALVCQGLREKQGSLPVHCTSYWLSTFIPL